MLKILDNSASWVKTTLRKFLKKHNPKDWVSNLQDPRHPSYVTRPFHKLMTDLVKSLMSGCNTQRGIELMTELCGDRIPDTTLFDIVKKVDPKPLHATLVEQVKNASRNHIIKNDLPFNVIAVDGKMQLTSSKAVAPWSQWRSKGYYANRTLRAMHVSGAVPFFMAQTYIPANKNEGSAFKFMLEKLEENYKNTKLLDIFILDAGFCSKSITKLLDSKGYRYLIRIKSNMGEIFKAAQDATNLVTCDHIATECKDDTYTIRNITLGTLSFEGWDSVVTVVKQEKYRVIPGGAISDDEERIFLSNIPIDSIVEEYWHQIIRRYWRIENNGYFNMDYNLFEDDRPICTHAMELIGLIRMILANFFADFCATRLKKDTFKRYLSWHNLMEIVKFLFYEEQILLSHGITLE